MVYVQAITVEGFEAGGLGAVFQGEFNLFGAEELLFQLGEMAVVEDFAVIDDHDAAAELFDVVEVVGGEQHRGAKFAIDGAQKMADVIFGDYVEADGGLVEEEERGIVEERGGEVAAHTFAEGKFAYWRVQVIADIENGVEMFHACIEVALRDVVDAAEEFEGFDDGDVPPELGALAEDDADGFYILAALAVGDVAVDADFAAGGDQDAGEHLDRGGFSGAVGADVTDHFAAFDCEADAIHGGDGAVIADEKILDGAPNAFAAFESAEVLAEIVNVNEGVSAHRCFNSSICGVVRLEQPHPDPVSLLRRGGIGFGSGFCGDEAECR